VIPVAPHAHGNVLRGNGHVRRNLRQRAVKIRVEHRKVRNARKQPQRLAHDVNGDRRVQRRESRVAFNLVDQCRRDALVLANSRSPADHAVSDGRRGRDLARFERIGYQLEGNRAAGHCRCLIHQLLIRRVFDPELPQIGANAVDRAFKEPRPLAVAGFIQRKLDRRRTAVQDQNRQ